MLVSKVELALEMGKMPQLKITLRMLFINLYRRKHKLVHTQAVESYAQARTHARTHTHTHVP